MKVFLSFAHEDRKAIEDVISGLEAANVEVWGHREVEPGDNWALQIGKALEQSSAMIVFVSPRSVKSSHVQHEVEYALTSPRYEGRLVVVEVKPTEGVPWILRKFKPVRLYESPAKAKRDIVSRVRHLARATRNGKSRHLAPA